MPETQQSDRNGNRTTKRHTVHNFRNSLLRNIYSQVSSFGGLIDVVLIMPHQRGDPDQGLTNIAPIPVNPLISPRRARAYTPFLSAFSATSRGVAT